MTRKYYFTFSYNLDGVNHTIKNGFLYDTKEEAFEHLGKSIVSTLTLGTDVAITKASVQYKNV